MQFCDAAIQEVLQRFVSLGYVFLCTHYKSIIQTYIKTEMFNTVKQSFGIQTPL